MATFGAATMKGHLKVLQFLKLACRPRANGWLERYVVRCGLHRPVVKELRNICSPPEYWFDNCFFAGDCLVGLDDQRHSQFAAPLHALHQLFSNIVRCAYWPSHMGIGHAPNCELGCVGGQLPAFKYEIANGLSNLHRG